MTRRKFIPILLITLSVVLSQAVGSYAISWSSNLKSSLKKAKSQRKPVMVDFYTNWCSWCEKMDRETFSDQKVNRLARKFICVKINGDRDKDAVEKYGIKGYPTVLFFAANGKLVRRIGGYVEPVKFAKAMQNVLASAKPVPVKKSVRGRKGVLPLRTKPKPPVTEKEKDKEKPLFKLSGIIYQPDKLKAIVNDEIVSVGDKIDGAEVLKITVNSVRLYYKRREIVIKMEE